MKAHAIGPTSTALLSDTIAANFDRAVASAPDRIALISHEQGVRWTYAELADRIDRVATGLLEAGLRTGDRVGIWAVNCAEWVLVQYATAKIGAILVTINPAYRSHELAHALGQAGVRWLVSSPGYKTSDYRAILAAVRDDCPDLEQVVFLGSDEWDALAATAPDSVALEARAATIEPDDPVNIQYTSGTTGAPKGATLSHRNILNNGFFVGELLRYGPDDRVCIPVPFYHCFGMVMGNLACTSHAACMVIPAATFDAGATLDAVQAYGCTSLYGVPTMFIAELAHPRFSEFDLSTLRTGIMAGSPCPSEVMRQVITEMHMRDVSICYGMTETSPVSTQTRIDDAFERRVGTVGTAGPHVEVQIVDPTARRTLERGEVGELCTRGYGVMLGYWGDTERTAEVIDDGWMRTGDLATMDEQGYCRIVGRIKDMVIRGGENIYPREIEECLHLHPDVVDVQVVGVPDAHYGEELCAWIRTDERATLTEDTVREFCRQRLAHFKVPRHILFVDDFPMTVTGKVQKYQMREISIERLNLGVGRA